jgi:hypothetical protein
MSLGTGQTLKQLIGHSSRAGPVNLLHLEIHLKHCMALDSIVSDKISANERLPST